MKNPKCPECDQPMKKLPRYEGEFKKWGGRLGGSSGVFRVLNNAKPFAPLLGLVGQAAITGFTFYLAGRALGRSMGQYVDDKLDSRFVCYDCNIIEVDPEDVPASAGTLGGNTAPT